MSDTDTDTDDEAQDEDPFGAEEAIAREHELNADRRDANPGGTGALTGPQADEYDPITLYNLQRHRNGDETAVLVCTFGNGYQVLAFDVDAGGQLLDVETVGDTTDEDKAVGMAEYWLDQNPEGVLGAGADDDGGFLASLGLGGGGA